MWIAGRVQPVRPAPSERSRDRMPRDVLVGGRFGRLTVQAFVYVLKRRMWMLSARCVCDCGSSVTVRVASLRGYGGGATRSCGCLNSEASSERMRRRHAQRRAKRCTR